MLDLPLTQDAVDWDAVLDPSALMQLLGVPVTCEAALPAMSIVPLPNDWVDLLMPPYNLDIGNMGENTGICLLTGTQVTFGPLFGDGSQLPIVDFIRGFWKCGPTLVLRLTGDYTSQIQYASLEFNVFFHAPDAWLDKNGTPDHGLRLGKLLSLNRAVLAEILDDYLSGKFHGKLQ
jgi:hypothetical protein